MFDGAQLQTFFNGVLTGLGTATAGGLIYFVRWLMNPAKNLPAKIAIGKALVVAWLVSVATLFAVLALQRAEVIADFAVGLGALMAWGMLTIITQLWTRLVLRRRSPWDSTETR